MILEFHGLDDSKKKMSEHTLSQQIIFKKKKKHLKLGHMTDD